VLKLGKNFNKAWVKTDFPEFGGPAIIIFATSFKSFFSLERSLGSRISGGSCLIDVIGL
jgi:hypothetical protein